MNFVTNFFDRIAQYFENNVDNTPAGVDAVVCDYRERQELGDRQKTLVAQWSDVERIASDGFFNSVTEANVHLDLGEYGEYVVTLNLEDELPEFMDSLNLEIEDLPMLVNGDYNIPVVREGGEWRIHWEELSEWSLYAPESGHEDNPHTEEDVQELVE